MVAHNLPPDNPDPADLGPPQGQQAPAGPPDIVPDPLQEHVHVLTGTAVHLHNYFSLVPQDQQPCPRCGWPGPTPFRSGPSGILDLMLLLEDTVKALKLVVEESTL